MEEYKQKMGKNKPREICARRDCGHLGKMDQGNGTDMTESRFMFEVESTTVGD